MEEPLDTVQTTTEPISDEAEPDEAEAAKILRPTRTPFTAEEQHRLSEVLLYCYFNQRDESDFSNMAFWNAIREVCVLNGIDSLCVSKAIRILMADGNAPTDHEIWYLLDKMELSVRQIRSISGIYWQKQKRVQEEILASGAPKCVPRITDPAFKKGIKDFLFAMYNVLGVLQFTDAKALEKALY